MRINREYYRGNSSETFFLFEIEIALKQDFILFPTHKETIDSAEFISIDMCFFTEEEIRIATLVVDMEYRTELAHVKYAQQHWSS